ncbi:MAG TPA: 4Fe-4S dicluster domain-containing protein [Propionibacterium sp.]|nr:4Fe-4S dicluster domain-containing protein [Propionibacterium sp.]
MTDLRARVRRVWGNQLSGPTDPTADARWPDPPARKGFFTDTSICIGCKACEVACKEWNHVPSRPGGDTQGTSYDNTGHLGADTWRHVAFIEQDAAAQQRARESGARLVSLGMPARVGAAPAASDPAEPPGFEAVRWLMSSDVCKHCTHAGCLDACPTGALFRTEFGTVVVQADVCNGCGYCVAACPFGVIGRREKDGVAVIAGEPVTGYRGGVAQKCTLCYDRISDGLQPACAQTCPTTSITFGDHADMVALARDRLAALHAEGRTEARLYGANPDDGVGGTGSVFLLLDEPEAYGLPPDPVVPTARLARMFTAAGTAGTVMMGLAVAVFGIMGRHG